MEVEIYKMIYKKGIDINNLKILGEEFVKNNRNKGKLAINNKKMFFPIKGILSFHNIKQNKIQMILSKNIFNQSCMFSNCDYLESFSASSFDDIKNFNGKESIIDNENFENDEEFDEEFDEELFSCPNSDIDEPSLFHGIKRNVSFISENSVDYSCLNDKEVSNFDNKLMIMVNNFSFINLSGMFSDCKSLVSLPDISELNTNKVMDMSYMFSNCEALKSLPDISKWNTNNIIDMSYMFSNCEALKSIPDISKWNTNNVIDMSYMFSNCKLLESLPDISKWNINNVNNLSHMLSNCESLLYLPDLSKWNTDKVIDMSYMFNNCKSLINFPNISRWNTYNVIDMNSFFLIVN